MHTMISRRFFIGGAFGFAALGPRLAFAAKPGAFADGKPALTFGVLSDVHIGLASGGRKLLPSYDTRYLEKAFGYFRDQGADAVVIAGDMAHHGCAGELKAVADAWFKVFPNDRAPDGRHVERLFVFGNHDNGTKRAAAVFRDDQDAIKANLLTLDPKRHWDDAFHDEWTPFFRRNVKGYDFVGVHWTVGDCRGKNERFAKGLVDYYDSIRSALDPHLPFFHIQHPHPRETVHGAVWGQDDGESVKALSRHPNAVSFSGHSHTTLVDDRSIWQGAFTALGTATLRDVGANGLTSGPMGFENYRTPPGPDCAKRNTLKVMPVIDRYAGKQGQLVRVYSDRIVFARRDFITDLPLTDDLVMPLPAAESKPFAFATRQAAAKAPRFASDAKLAIRACEAKPRGGKAAKPKPCVEIVIPPAMAERSALGIVCEVSAPGADGDELSVRVLTPAFRYAPTAKRVHRPTVCRIALDRLAPGDLEFKVRAVSAWGRTSDPLVGTFRRPPAA